MTLVNTAMMSFITTVIRLITALVINKVIAIYIGPAGLAIIGQFQNFTQLAITAGQGAITNGVTKYAAEYGRDCERIPKLLSTSARITVISSVFVGAVILIFSNYISLSLLSSERYSYVIVIFGFTIALHSANSLLLSILNGLKEITTWAKISIMQSIYSLIFTTLLILFVGLDGALIAIASNQSVIFVVVIYMLRRHAVINFSNFIGPFDKPEARKLGGFALMAMTSAATAPFSHMIIRNYIGETLGWEAAGYWQAMWYISSMYLMVVSTTLSVYYLPKLSEINSKSELRMELTQGYKIVMPIVIGMSLTIFLLKDFIIFLLFTEDFSSMRELFFWQLIGDVLKLAAWLLSYLLIAKGMTKQFISSEIIFSLCFLILSIFFVNQHGLIGTSYSFAMSYAIYFSIMIYVTRNEWIGV